MTIDDLKLGFCNLESSRGPQKAPMGRLLCKLAVMAC